jgi:hypothetical protein
MWNTPSRAPCSSKLMATSQIKPQFRIHQGNPSCTKTIGLPDEKMILMGWRQMFFILGQCKTDVGIAIHEDRLAEDLFKKMPARFSIE